MLRARPDVLFMHIFSEKQNEISRKNEKQNVSNLVRKCFLTENFIMLYQCSLEERCNHPIKFVMFGITRN